LKLYWSRFFEEPTLSKERQIRAAFIVLVGLTASYYGYTTKQRILILLIVMVLGFVFPETAFCMEPVVIPNK
jgi:hypothetical protein